MKASDAFAQLKFRDPERARGLRDALDRLVQHADHAPVSVMHVCGSHEQAIAKFGLRAAFPEDLQVIMGPGCPVCVTDVPEVDEAVALAKQGVRRVQVICPGFSADCLETLEEIDMQNREIFLQAGGEQFHYIPALNAEAGHIQVMADVIKQHAGDWLTLPVGQENAGERAKAIGAKN